MENFKKAFADGTTGTRSDITQTTDSYSYTKYCIWRTGDDMTSGGTYGIYGLSRIAHSVQNVLGMKGQVYFGDLTDATKVVNQCRGVEGAIDLDTTYAIGVLDDISSIGGYLGPYNGANITTTAGGTLSVVDLVFLPETNMSVDTHGIKLTAKTTSAGVRMDYGLRIQNQGISTANIYLENENNSKTAVENDIKMSNTAGDVNYGINMGSANYTTADIMFSSGAIFTHYAGTPNAALTAPVNSLCIDTTNHDLYINTDGTSAWTALKN